MNKIFNKFMIEFPKNTVFGWGNKVKRIDTMKILALSYHQRRFSIFNREYPYVVKIKYLDFDKTHNYYYANSCNTSIFHTPFSNPIVDCFDDKIYYENNHFVISRRFKNEIDCVKFAKDIRINIDHVNNKIDTALSIYTIN